MCLVTSHLGFCSKDRKFPLPSQMVVTYGCEHLFVAVSAIVCILSSYPSFYKFKSMRLHTKTKTYCNKVKLLFILDSYYSYRKVKLKVCIALVSKNFITHGKGRTQRFKIFERRKTRSFFGAHCTRSEFAFTHRYCCTLSQFESERTILNCTLDQNSLQTLQPSCPRSYSKGIKRNNNSNRKFTQNL